MRNENARKQRLTFMKFLPLSFRAKKTSLFVRSISEIGAFSPYQKGSVVFRIRIANLSPVDYRRQRPESRRRHHPAPVVVVVVVVAAAAAAGTRAPPKREIDPWEDSPPGTEEPLKYIFYSQL